ncbi:MAG: hypothetical protein OHK0029_12190 [Armatimonadaceae bacterium]
MVRSDSKDRLQPFTENPRYWQYKEKPVLLLGGSVEDNLFQISHLREHLDLLKSAGGNYIRCTMSSRDPGDVWAFERGADGRYDLNQPGREYWRRFTDCLKLCAERDIMVQIEVWDRFDFARDPWNDNPFNPKNNRNYTAEDCRLPEKIETHPGRRENGFFRSVPRLENNIVLLPFQHAFVDDLLRHALPYGIILYCMDNETNESPEWGKYWAEYIQEKARKAGATVYCTEMWDAHNLADPQHNATFDHPALYAFVDISQNNHQVGQVHYDRALEVRKRLEDRPRPINTVKTYGADTGRYGTDRDGIERFWRHIFAGLASMRFHRPASGIGLNETAQVHLRSARLFAEAFPVFTAEPRPDLLTGHGENEAFLLAEEGKRYVVLFLSGSKATLRLSEMDKPASVRWLNIEECRWEAETPVQAAHSLSLATPGKGMWVGVLQIG